MTVSKKLIALLEGSLTVTKQLKEKENIFLVTLQSVKNLPLPSAIDGLCIRPEVSESCGHHAHFLQLTHIFQDLKHCSLKTLTRCVMVLTYILHLNLP